MDGVSGTVLVRDLSKSGECQGKKNRALCFDAMLTGPSRTQSGTMINSVQFHFVWLALRNAERLARVHNKLRAD